MYMIVPQKIFKKIKVNEMLLVTYNTGNLLCTCIPNYDIFICKFTRTYKGLKE